MSGFVNIGTHNAGVFTPQVSGSPAAGGILTLDEAGIASGGAFLRSELEKLDMKVREPLSSITYPRDIPIRTGGGWVDYVSAMAVAYGMTGGSGDSAVHAGGANGIPVVSANMQKGLYKAHTFAAALRVMFVDMQKSNQIGRSLEQMLQNGIRTAYDKHMDQNVYLGIEEYGTSGLLNNPDVVETQVQANGKGTAWKDKTKEEILRDVNTALSFNWEAAEFDSSAIPNHILLPFEQYHYLLTTMVSDLATETILDYLLKNNVASKNGGSLFIGATRYNKGAGTDGMDRMVVYTHNERFVAVDELVPLSRIMTAPNVEHVCYDTAYMANLSEVMVYYPQTISYWDGI